ncbi:MAG: fibronectin type III domain-containing protein [Syntrophomonas sp.]|nr:fibronectin type III domain-containing protein [Syntrophomonas sp.]
MSYTLTVAGTEKHVVQDTLEISKAMTYQVDTCKCQIVSTAKPNEGDEVIVTDDTEGILFGGIVVNVKFINTDAQVWEIDCNDYTELIDRRLVTETYENQSASYIFSDIIAKYTTGLVDVVTAGAPNVEYIQFNYIRPSECFKRLCDYVGWQWYADDEKNIKYFEPNSLMVPGPLQLLDTTRDQWGAFQFNVDKMGLRNKVYVLGGTALSDPATFEYVADGKQTTFNLAHKPHNLSMMVNAVPVVVGIENIDEDDGTYGYMMNYQEKYVMNASGTAIIPAGTTVTFIYQYDIPVITYDENIPSQQAMAAVQGGDGIYEHMISDDKLTTLEAAYAVAQKDLREHSDPNVRGSFVTLEPGWEPGQIITVNLTDRGINNSYMVQSVRLRYQVDWFYTVEFGGRLLTIADFLQALVSKQQQADMTTTIISKINSQVDNIGWSDISVQTLAEIPYYVGDTDAICGFVELNTGAALPDQPTAKAGTDTLLLKLVETQALSAQVDPAAGEVYFLSRNMTAAIGTGTDSASKAGTESLSIKIDESVSGYWIYRKAGAGAYSIIAVVPLSVTTYQDDDVVSGTTYTYQVKKYENGEWTESTQPSVVYS